MFDEVAIKNKLLCSLDILVDRRLLFALHISASNTKKLKKKNLINKTFFQITIITLSTNRSFIKAEVITKNPKK